MNTSLSWLAIAAVSLSACTGEAADFKSTMLGARVYPLQGGVFEVVPPIGSNGTDFWCAASDYARRQLGASWQTPIYISRGLAPGEASGRKSTVLFTLNPVVSDVPQSGVRRIGAFHVGDSMTVQQGDGQCNVFPRWF